MGIWIFVGGIGLVLMFAGTIAYQVGLHGDNKRTINSGMGILIAGFCALSAGICFALNFLATDEQVLFSILNWVSQLMRGQLCSL